MICIDASVPATQIPWQLLWQGKNKKKQRLAKVDAVDVGKAAVAVKPLMLTSGASGRVRALFSLRALRSLLLLLNGFLLLLLPFRRRTIVVSAEEKQEKREAVVVRFPAVMMPWRAREVAAARRAREVDVATRRSMAVRRIASGEEGDDGRSIREFSLFVSGRGYTLFTQS